MQKRWLLFMLLLVLSAGACANSLANAGFEQGTEQWQIWKGGIQLDDNIVRSGNAALRLDFSATQAATGFGVWQTIVLDQVVDQDEMGRAAGADDFVPATRSFSRPLQT